MFVKMDYIEIRSIDPGLISAGTYTRIENQCTASTFNIKTTPRAYY